MRCTASLLAEGCTETQVIERVHADNLYQYPTRRMLRKMARVCLARLSAMGHPGLTQQLACGHATLARQICLYAMMKQNRLVRDFMLEVIAEKFRARDFSFSKADSDRFLAAIASEHASVAAWSVSTREKIRQVLTRLLVENQFLDSHSATGLNPVLPEPELRQAMLDNNDSYLLPVFNDFMP